MTYIKFYEFCAYLYNPFASGKDQNRSDLRSITSKITVDYFLLFSRDHFSFDVSQRHCFFGLCLYTWNKNSQLSEDIDRALHIDYQGLQLPIMTPRLVVWIPFGFGFGFIIIHGSFFFFLRFYQNPGLIIAFAPVVDLTWESCMKVDKWALPKKHKTKQKSKNNKTKQNFKKVTNTHFGFKNIWGLNLNSLLMK